MPSARVPPRGDGDRAVHHFQRVVHEGQSRPCVRDGGRDGVTNAAARPAYDNDAA